MSYSASFQVDKTSDGLDKFMQCKTGAIVRKFNDTLWPSGSINEFWIAFTVRINMIYPFQNVNSSYASPGMAQFMVGICRTDGVVFGQISASTDVSKQNLIGMYMDDKSPSNTNPAEYTGSYAYAKFIAFPRSYTTGSYTEGAAYGYPLIPFTSGSEERTMFAFRFVTGSGASWTTNAFHPSGIQAYQNPISASSQVAAFLSQSYWASQSFDGYSYVGGVSVSNDRATNGYFDGIFISWQQWFQELHISDVVVRLL